MTQFAERDRLISELFDQVHKAPEKSQKFGRYECTLATEVPEDLRTEICKRLERWQWKVYGQGNTFRLIREA